MRAEARDAAFLWDMLDAARSVSTFVSGKTFEQYVEDEMLRSAVERKLEIIGEAAPNVSDELKARASAVPWRPIVASRHILAHEYGDVRQDIVWRIATVRVPELITSLEPLLPHTT